jgi:hypothetical protein
MRSAALVVALLCVAAGSAWAARSEPDARALAEAVNLTKADLPGYRATRQDLRGLSKDRRFVRCAKTVPAAQAVAIVPSKSFERDTHSGHESVHSEVAVRPAADVAARDLKAYGTSRARSCLEKFIRRESGSDLLKVTVKPLSPPVPNGAGLRIAMIVRAEGRRVRAFVDFLLIGHEDVEAALIMSGGPAPPARGREDDLLNLVESRLLAQLGPVTG